MNTDAQSPVAVPVVSCTSEVVYVVKGLCMGCRTATKQPELFFLSRSFSHVPPTPFLLTAWHSIIADLIAFFLVPTDSSFGVSGCQGRHRRLTE